MLTNRGGKDWLRVDRGGCELFEGRNGKENKPGKLWTEQPLWKPRSAMGGVGVFN